MALKILDRYLVRQIVPPLLLALLGLTFVLMMPPILQNAAKLIEKGVSWSLILRVLLTLVPQALCVTIPMAVLYGILLGLGPLTLIRPWITIAAGLTAALTAPNLPTAGCAVLAATGVLAVEPWVHHRWYAQPA